MIEDRFAWFDRLLGLTPEALVGALALSVTIAGLVVGLYRLSRLRRKVEPITALTAAMIVGNLACMGVAFVAAPAIRQQSEWSLFEDVEPFAGVPMGPEMRMHPGRPYPPFGGPPHWPPFPPGGPMNRPPGS